MKLFGIVCCFCLMGCTQPTENVVFIDNGHNHYSPHKVLPDYVRELSYSLVSSSHYVTAETPVGVASFVPLDDFSSSNLFGMQLAESFVYEIQQYGFSVIDHKSTGFVRITDEGDLVLSRNVKELNKRLPIEYLLVGTYTKTADGVLVNVRLVGARSQVVVATAQKLVPTYIYQGVVEEKASLKLEARSG